jgi:cyclopropane-fatty-acyl-phospholipid synthase
MMIEKLLASNILPDAAIRFGIRRLLKARLAEETKATAELQQQHLLRLVKELKTSQIAVNTADANAQHYEIPTEFFRLILGPQMKYSCGYWPSDTTSFEESEEEMLKLTSERAELSDGQEILELGCGWGSLTLWMAGRFPQSSITAVSNSSTQKQYIEEEARRRNLRNITVITADMNLFTTERSFDRVVSVEMFEHMRNYERLLEKVASFLKPDGKLFVHIFAHKEYAYKFEPRDASDWMAKYFFAGGIMPSDRLFYYFDRNLSIEKHWRLPGTHYQKTSEAWLKNMDLHRSEIIPILEKTYGREETTRWWVYWRVFFMACAELWGCKNGKEWIVSHYLFSKA